MCPLCDVATRLAKEGRNNIEIGQAGLGACVVNVRAEDRLERHLQEAHGPSRCMQASAVDRKA